MSNATVENEDTMMEQLVASLSIMGQSKWREDKVFTLLQKTFEVVRATELCLYL